MRLCVWLRSANLTLTGNIKYYADNQNISFLPAIMTTSSRPHGEFCVFFFLKAPDRTIRSGSNARHSTWALPEE